MKIGHRQIGPEYKPFIIAEMSGNHNQSLARALAIVDAAKASGADAIKLQTYTAATMTIDSKAQDFRIKDKKSLWYDRSLYELYKEAYTPWEWHQPIFDRCKDLGIICFSTPFDRSAVDFLQQLNVPAYKIASFENTDIELLKIVARTGKPVIMSTGMATTAELDIAVKTLRSHGCEELVLLKCTSTYPANPRDSNIMTIPHMAALFNTYVGLSDHTMGIGVAVSSIALGAVIVEKHFTLARIDGGVDAAFSLEPDELKSLVIESERAWLAKGLISYGPTEAEQKSLQFRRSLYIVENMLKGDVLTEHNLRALRPAQGISPVNYEIVLGKKINQNLPEGTPLQWTHLFFDG